MEINLKCQQLRVAHGKEQYCRNQESYQIDIPLVAQIPRYSRVHFLVRFLEPIRRRIPEDIASGAQILEQEMQSLGHPKVYDMK